MLFYFTQEFMATPFLLINTSSCGIQVLCNYLWPDLYQCMLMAIFRVRAITFIHNAADILVPSQPVKAYSKEKSFISFRQPCWKPQQREAFGFKALPQHGFLNSKGFSFQTKAYYSLEKVKGERMVLPARKHEYTCILVGLVIV